MQKSMYSRFLLFISIMLVPCFSQAQISKDSTKFLGNVASESLSEEFLTFWNQVTPENASKWINIEKERDVMTWTILDSIYVSAKRNGLPIKLHTLVWGQQQPAWINQLSQNEQREEVEEWFEALAERYPDADMIDVVNEPLHHPAPYRNALGGSGETGWDWVVWSFKKAREVFPNSKLLINDYDILNNYKNTVPKYRELIGILKDSMLLDGIGCQSHFLESYSTKLISRMLDSLATHEIPIYISEFDLQFTSDQGQLTKYKQVFPLLWEHPMVKGVTLWGYKEGSIWRDDAYLKRQDKSHRPAFTWLIEYFNNGESISLENIVFEDDTTYLFPGQLYYPKVRFEPALYSEEFELLGQVENSNILAKGDGNYLIALEAGESFYTLATPDGKISDSTKLIIEGNISSVSKWSEDFEEMENGTILNKMGNKWSSYAAKGTFSVQDGKFVASNTESESIWLSEITHIEADEIEISIEVQTQGNMEPEDYLKMYYIDDRGNAIEFFNEPDNINNDEPIIIQKSGIQTDKIQLMIKQYNTSTSEIHSWDNILIQESTSTNNTDFNYTETKVFPNPATNEFSVSLVNGEKKAELQLFDISGRKLSTFIQFNNKSKYIIPSGIKPGMYFLEILMANKREVKTIIIE